MAGSDHSGEDMEAGRTNRAENTTKIWAQRFDESDTSVDFNGNAILIVEESASVEDPDDFDGGRFTPGHPSTVSRGQGRAVRPTCRATLAAQVL